MVAAVAPVAAAATTATAVAVAAMEEAAMAVEAGRGETDPSLGCFGFVVALSRCMGDKCEVKAAHSKGALSKHRLPTVPIRALPGW